MKKCFLILIMFVFLMSISMVYADDLSEITQSGVLRFGHHLDYAPFVYEDSNGVTTGIDIALMEEVARRMGVRLQSIPLAWDGITDSLQLGQSDVIGGGLSRTDERAEKIDFTRTYFTGQAVFICLDAYYKPEQITLHNFYQAKIGVEKGSNFEQWIRTYLVKPGYVHQSDVYAYGNISDLMRALNNAAVNLIILDQDLYESLYKGTEKYKIFYEGFQTEEYAYGLRKGSTLTPVINSHLSDMIKDGTAQAIVNRFFSSDLPEAQLIRPQAAQPAAAPEMPAAAPAVPTAVSAVAPAPGACINGMAFVADVSVTDGQAFNPGETFRKTWRIKNNGTCAWTKDYRFELVSGTNMGTNGFQFPIEVQPGGIIEIYADLIAPATPGSYKGNWQMRSPQGESFGQIIWVDIRVNGDSPAIPQDDGQTRTIPVIDYFYADPDFGFSGDSTTIYWSASNAAGVTIYVDGYLIENGFASGSYQLQAPIQGEGEHEIELVAHSVTDDVYASIWFTMYKDPSYGGGEY